MERHYPGTKASDLIIERRSPARGHLIPDQKVTVHYEPRDSESLSTWSFANYFRLFNPHAAVQQFSSTPLHVVSQSPMQEATYGQMQFRICEVRPPHNTTQVTFFYDYTSKTIAGLRYSTGKAERVDGQWVTDTLGCGALAPESAIDLSVSVHPNHPPEKLKKQLEVIRSQARPIPAGPNKEVAPVSVPSEPVANAQTERST